MAAVAPIELHRTRDRKHLPVELRVERVEEDADVMESNFGGLYTKVDTINARLLGVMLSTASAAVLFALDLITRHK